MGNGRGGYGVPEESLTRAIDNLGKARWEQSGKSELGEIIISSDTLFTESGWMFLNPYTGQEYARRLVDMNHEEAMEVCRVLFSKVQELQRQEGEYQKKIKELGEDLALYSTPPSLQLLG